MFINAVFSGTRTHFSGASFAGERTYFNRARFSGEATDFNHATFSGKETNFSEATVAGMHVQSLDDAMLSGAVFSGEHMSFNWLEAGVRATKEVDHEGT